MAYLIQKPVVGFAKRQKLAKLFLVQETKAHVCPSLIRLLPFLSFCLQFCFVPSSSAFCDKLLCCSEENVGCVVRFRSGDAILQILISENCNYLLFLRSIMRRGSEERWRNLEYFAATRRFVGALSEKCAARMMMTTLLRAQRAHEMRDSKHDPGGPREMNCRRVRRQMQKSDGRASDEKLCGRGCLKKINPQLRNARKILQIFFFLRRICCGFLSFVVVVVVACLPLSSSLQQTLVFLARDLSSVSPPLVPVSDYL